jgi:hypothetical protein
MNDEMIIKKATRVGVRPLIGLYSESGCGKTYSALLLARGFVGKQGKVAIIDSESGRASLYADMIDGGFDTLELNEPFSPENYIKAIKAIEKAGYSIGIIDSATHEWSEVLNMAAENEARSGKPGLHVWRLPKLSHAKFMVALLRSTIPWVVCVRSKCKSRQTKDEKGKTVIVRDEFTSPLQSEEFTFELTIHGEIMPDHSFRLTKSSHPELRKCFADGKPITIATGEAVARWCNCPEGGVSTPEQQKESPPAATSGGTRAKLKATLWDLTRKQHGVKKADDKDSATVKAGVDHLQQWLWDESILGEMEALETISDERLAEIIEAVKEKVKV